MVQLGLQVKYLLFIILRLDFSFATGYEKFRIIPIVEVIDNIFTELDDVEIYIVAK